MEDQNLQTYIGGYLYNSPKYFLGADANELARQFVDEYDTDLGFDEIVDEIEYAQGRPDLYR